MWLLPGSGWLEHHETFLHFSVAWPCPRGELGLPDSMVVAGQPDFFRGGWLLPEQVLPEAGSNRTASPLRDVPGPESLTLILS